MKQETIKLTIRYIILTFFMYLAWMVTRPEWVISLKDIEAMEVTAIITSVFAGLTLILKFHFETKIKKDNQDED